MTSTPLGRTRGPPRSHRRSGSSRRGARRRGPRAGGPRCAGRDRARAQARQLRQLRHALIPAPGPIVAQAFLPYLVIFLTFNRHDRGFHGERGRGTRGRSRPGLPVTAIVSGVVRCGRRFCGAARHGHRGGRGAGRLQTFPDAARLPRHRSHHHAGARLRGRAPGDDHRAVLPVPRRRRGGQRPGQGRRRRALRRGA